MHISQLLFLSYALFGYINLIFSSATEEEHKYRIQFDPLRVPEFKEAINRTNYHFDHATVSDRRVGSQPIEKELFLDVLVSELEAVLQSSPEIIATIINHLKDSSYLNLPEYRYSIFVGPPGSGKTTTAKAIAYHLYKAGWDAHVIWAGDVLGDKRNQTAVRLRDILTSVTAVSKPVIIIIDELNELLENAHDEHYDTSANAKFLWQFLDQQENNHRFFLIGTMNDDTKLPQPFKSRIFLRRVEFQPLTLERSVEQFKHHLARASIALSPEVTSEQLQKFLADLKNCSARDLRELIIKIKMTMKSQSSQAQNELQSSDLEFMAQEYKRNRMSIEYDKPFETKDERDERHFIQRTLLDILMKECVATLYDYNNGGQVKKVYQEVPAQCFEAVLATLLESQRKLAEPMRKKSKETEELHKKRVEEQKAAERSQLRWYRRIF